MFCTNSDKDMVEDVIEETAEDVIEETAEDVIEETAEDVIEETVDVIEDEPAEELVDIQTAQTLNAFTINEINKTGLHSKLKKAVVIDGCYKANDIIGVLSNNIERDKRLINDYDEDEVVVKKTKCGHYMRSARFFTQKGIERYLSEGRLFSYENACLFFKVQTKNTNYLKWDKQFEKIKECEPKNIKVKSNGIKVKSNDVDSDSDDESDDEADVNVDYCYDNESDSELDAGAESDSELDAVRCHDKKSARKSRSNRQLTYKTNLLLKWLFDKRKACKQLGTITTVANVLKWLDNADLVDSLDKRKIEYLKSLL